MIVSGTVTKKMVPQIVRLYNQMPEPKYVLSMGACASGGGPFKEGHNVASGGDTHLPGHAPQPKPGRDPERVARLMPMAIPDVVPPSLDDLQVRFPGALTPDTRP